MNNEIWKDIPGYEGYYQVSTKGNVKGRNGKMLKQDTRKNTGYKYVVLSVNKKRFHANIQRLVAKTFIPNPQGYPIVNHKNENRADNRVENLEWCTQSYNVLASSKLQKQYKRICQLNKNGELIKIHESIHHAARHLGNVECAANICAVARGKHQTYKGYIWKYENN